MLADVPLAHFNNKTQHNMSEGTPPQGKDWMVTLLLAIFVGSLGVDRFYTGHTGLGVAKLLTCGGAGIWWLIDIIFIVTDKYKDAQGNALVKK
jgi:TM2 domain-containing membrane protein YozV